MMPAMPDDLTIIWKAIGEKMIAQELENIPNEKTRSIAKGYIEKVAHGERDFRF